MDIEPIHARIRKAVEGRSNREVAELTGCHPETVRRYINGYTPSVEFLQRLAQATGLDPGWLIFGQDRRLEIEQLIRTIDQIVVRLDAIEEKLQTANPPKENSAARGPARKLFGIFPPPSGS